MRKTALFIAALLLLVGCSDGSLTQYVNPLVGTDGHGHTFPGAIVPFGQIQPSPDTRLEGWDGCSGYHYSDDTIYGFSHTHLSGTGVEDYCDVLLMPVVEQEANSLQFGPDMREGYKHHFRHKNETAKAGYYRVMLDDGGLPCTIVELTADRRVAYHRYTYTQERGNWIVIDLRHRDVLLDGHIALSDEGLIVGHRHSSSWNPDQHLFFAIRSSEPLKEVRISDDSTQAMVMVDAKQVELQVAISGVDVEGAVGNLITARHEDFESAHHAAERTWEEALGKLEVDGGSKEQRRCYYTALYHCMTAPYLWSDEDGRYRGTDGQIHVVDEGREVYTVFSLWDTYRALQPLLTVIEPERTVDFAYSAMKQFEQGGELPMWELAGHETHCMIGYHAAPMLLEAMQLADEDGTLAGYRPIDILRAMVATSNRTAEHRAYAQQGYLSSEIDNESVSKTLEYAYDDWCIAQLANMIASGRWCWPSEAEMQEAAAVAATYWKRSQSWQNVLDGNGFAHARRNGGWVTPFDPTEVNNHFTEANSWQYSTYVPHDIDAWVDRLGGEQVALAFLDSLFEGQAQLSGRDQSDITGLIGMYAHGNEPSHHAAWLYTILGQPQKTEKYVSYILNNFYTSQPDGLCGNEDCGQMSAWYVLASLGMYKMCPGSNEWVYTKPLFELKGEHFAQQPLSVAPMPDSLRVAPCPVFDDWRMQVVGSRKVSIAPLVDGGTVRYMRANGPSWHEFSTPLTVDHEGTLLAVCSMPGRLTSPAVAQEYRMTQTDRHVTYLTQPAPQYTENGPEGMVDNIYGTPNFRIGGWQGWQEDMVAVVELDKEQTVRYIGVDCLENMRAWIFFPRAIEVETSLDGEHWTPFGTAENTIYAATHDRQEEYVSHTFTVGNVARARYVKITARNYGPLPSWHVSAGQQAWLFADEIIIR